MVTENKQITYRHEVGVDKETLKAMQSAAPFFKATFGELIQDVTGLLSDQLKFYRINLFIRNVQKTEEILKARGLKINEIKSAPLNFLLPVYTQLAASENETLSERWATLLANAIDPNYPNLPRTAYVNILNELSPADVLLLEYFFNQTDLTKETECAVKEILKHVNLTLQELGECINNLDRLNLLGVRNAIRTPFTTLYKINTCVRILPTDLGLRFMQAIKKEL